MTRLATTAIRSVGSPRSERSAMSAVEGARHLRAAPATPREGRRRHLRRPQFPRAATMMMTTTVTIARVTATMATTEPTEPTEPSAERSEADRRRGPFLSGIRARLLAWFVVLLALATAASVLVVDQILLRRLDQRINSALVQEAKEVTRLSRGNDPETGEPFSGRVRKIFTVFLQRNIPSRNEAIITFVGGELFLRSRPVVPYRLEQDPDLVERWGDLETTEK